MTTENFSFELLTPKEAAKFLRTTTASLATARCLRRGSPPFVKVGKRVLYRRADVERWIEACLVNPTREVKP